MNLGFASRIGAKSGQAGEPLSPLVLGQLVPGPVISRKSFSIMALA